MRKIHISMIQSIFSAKIVQRGLAYYEQNRVTDLAYDKPHHIWTSRVHGRKTYFVEVNYRDVANGVLTVYCDCPAFATYEECKHIVATIFTVNNYIDLKMNESTVNQTEQLLDLLTTFNPTTELDVLTDKLPMQVEYICTFDYSGIFNIELKTGIDHCYVVRDVFALLNNVLANERHYFTKRFSYEPNSHYFLQKDLDIFKLLHTMLMNEQVYMAKYDEYLGTVQKRTLTVSPLIISDLLKQLKERNCLLTVKGIEYEIFDFIEGELPFNFTIKSETKKNYLLQIDRLNEAVYLDLYRLLFINGIFYSLTDEQSTLLDLIFQVDLSQSELAIPKEQFDSFFSNALPLLKQIGAVELDKTVQNSLIDEPLQAKLFLQLKDHLLIGQLKYQYGIYEIDPFAEEKRDVTVVRDTNEEQVVMNLIEQAQFHYNGKDLYLDCTEEAVLYKFLYEVMPLLEEKVTLYLTEDVKLLISDDSFIPTANIKVNTQTNLLEIGFSIENVNEEEINHILQAVIEKKQYYRLQSGALISLEQQDFQVMHQFFDQFSQQQLDVQDNAVQLPVYHTGQVEQLADIRKTYHPSFKKLINDLNSPQLANYAVPKELDSVLRDYQKKGYQWLKTLSTYSLGGILADEMGLGKTIQTIALLLSEERKFPHLIIAPASVVYNWRNEFQTFAPRLTIDVIAGTPEERLEKITKKSESDVWITSYGTLRQDIDHYKEITFQTLILDEAQYIKNYMTKTSKVVRQIKAEKRFALSGTPIENSLDELWAIFQVVLPGLMPNQRSFKQLESEQIRALTKPFILRRLKKDVLSELPSKIESVHMSELTDEQKKLYVGYLKRIQTEATESIAESGFHANRMKILAGLTRLRQICCHPSLFLENYDGRSGKLDELMNMIMNLKESGRRALIFSQFTSMHELIKDQLHKQNIDYFYLHGQTQSADRVEMSERFNQGEKDIFLISLRAGGTGLNLTGADTVILYDLWWNPAVEDQAAGRAHRYGQKEVVQVIRFITEGTIEEKIYELQQQKRELIDEVIQTGESNLASLTEEDIRQLLSI